MNITFKTTSLVAAVSATLCANAWALEPQSIKLADGIRFTPSLEVSERYDDNFRASKYNEESSWITRLSPSFELAAEGHKSAYRLTYQADSDTFHSSHDDDNTDHHLTGDAGFEFDARNRLVLSAGYHKVEETATQDQTLENDKYTTSNIGGVYTYGARTARTQFELGANYEELRYQNSDHINADKERDSTALRGTVFYRVAPKTRLLAEARHTDYDYIDNRNRDSDNIAMLGGVTWDATAKTSGTVKVGGERKRFDRSNISSKSSAMWEAGVKWMPRTYSTFSLDTRRGLDEGEETASSIESMRTTLSWEHEWSDRLASTVSYSYIDNEYQDYHREDKIKVLGLGLTYEVRRWLDVGMGYKYADRDSSRDRQSFERNIYMINFNASL